MKTVKGFIASKQRELDAHPLFDQVRRDEPGVRERLAPRLTFPVMMLKGIARETEELVTEPTLKCIARELCTGAVGLDRCLLRDRAHEAARIASHALATEAYLAQNDACRVALLITIESAERALGSVERDTGSAMFEEKVDETLASLSLSAPVRQEAIALVDRCYAALTAMLDDIERSLAESASAPAPASRRAITRARTSHEPFAMLWGG